VHPNYNQYLDEGDPSATHHLNQTLPSVTPRDNPQTQARTQSNNRSQLQDWRPSPAIAPAVPSFGAPLPCFPLPSVPSLRPDDGDPVAANPHKRKRKSNQLGLTPAVEGDEDSGEEDAEDTSFGPLKDTLQFEYNGQTSVLGSAAEVAAWIAERKKRWPTKARVEEKQRDLSKQQEERTQARNKQQEEQAKLRRRLDNERSEARQKMDQAQAPHLQQNPADQAPLAASKDDRLQKSLEKHMLKVEKLRKKLEQSQAGIANSQSSLRNGPERIILPSEAKAQPGYKVTSGVTTHSLDTTDRQAETQNSAETNTVEAGHRSGSPSSLELVSLASADLNAQADSDSEPTSMDSSEPEEQTNQNPPRNGPPAKRQPQKAKICRYFLQSGRCRAGEQCAFAHELPERGSARTRDTQSKRPVPKERRTVRTSLYSRLVAQELALEDKRVLDAIMYLGNAGMLGVQMGLAGRDEE